MKPLISIGMPVYNGEKYLRQSIQSLLSQSHKKIELIISDNASTDGTSAICQEFAQRDSRVKYFRQKSNRGPLWNFNFVLQQAKAAYFMWAAHDDLWDSDWIRILLRNFSDEGAISFGHVVNIDKKGRVVRRVPPLRFPGNQRLRMIRYFMAEELNGKANIIYGLYRTALLKKTTMKEYKHCKFGQDMLFVYDYMQNGAVRTDTSVLLYKRLFDSNNNQLTLKKEIYLILLLDRLWFYITHITVASRYIDKLLLSILFPLKYIQAVVNNSLFIFKKHFL
jgi:glycosyltransferase involved in cell wall biosynthesis